MPVSTIIVVGTVKTKMNEQICTLCLRTSMDNFPAIEVNLQAILDDLLSKTILNISRQQNMICTECRNNLQEFCSFKKAYVDILDRTSQVSDLESGSSLDLKEFGNKRIFKSEHDVKNPMACSYCTQIKNLCFIPLNELKKNTRVVDMLEKHIPKLNLNNMEHIISCETCHQSLQGIISFITNCFDVKEKIGKYIEILDDKGRIDLRKVQAFIFKPSIQQENEYCNAIKREETPDRKPNLFLIKSEPELEWEHKIDLESVVKTEEIDIKSEVDISDGFIAHTNRHLRIYKDPPERIMNKCMVSTFGTIDISKRDNLTHGHPSEITMHKCEVCTFETKRKSYLKEHMWRHKNRSEREKYRCADCTFETLHRESLRRHKKSHKNPMEVPMHKCKVCTFETKYKRNLKVHLLIHGDPSERKMHKCQYCAFETFHTESLRRHRISHIDPMEIPVYKCEVCIFETKRKDCLKQHMLTHQDPSEREIYKCKDCVFQTICKKSVRRHREVHKDLPGRKKYKCEDCGYLTLFRKAMVLHASTHKDPSERKSTNVNTVHRR